jgi:uncharacterized protein YkwD
LRKIGAVALSIPVVVVVYLATLIRTRILVRVAVLVLFAIGIGLGSLNLAPPSAIVATPASTPRILVSADVRTVFLVGHDLRAPVSVEFSASMDPAAVAAALRIEPPVAVHILWDAAGRTLTIQPVERWQAGTLYSVAVGSHATDSTGARLRAPVRAAFLTASAGIGSIAATRTFTERVAVDTAFTIALDRPVDIGAATRALTVQPPIPGTLTELPAPVGGSQLRFEPAQLLAPDTTYRLSFTGLVDTDGVPFSHSPALSVRTVAAPAVVRFRPRDGAGDVERGAAVSVRFTQSMDRSVTGAAFRVLVDGTVVAGTVRWAEDDTVLVFDPADDFPYGATVRVEVSELARSTGGSALATTAARFTVEARPVPKPTAAPKPTSSPSSGGTVSAASWYAVETYYLKLMNCTRTGGLVTSTGSCSSPGGRDVAPLKLDSGISSKVARPYAKVLATRNLCSHFVGGNPGDRLRAAGYTSYRWAENLGCRSGDPYAAVLGSHLYFQSERSWSPPGGHYVNLMNAAYDRTGIGVWVASGRVRLVVVLYHP